MNIKVDINVCRVCLKTNKGVSIFSDEILIEKFQYTTFLKISKEDGLPDILCERCVKRLRIAYDFRRLCVISDTQMRAFISKVNNEFKQVAYSTTNSCKDLYDVKDDEIDLILESEPNAFKVEDREHQETTETIVEEQHNVESATAVVTFDNHFIISSDNINVIQENECISQQLNDENKHDEIKTIVNHDDEQQQEQQQQHVENEEFSKYIQEDEIDDNYMAEEGDEIHLIENDESEQDGVEEVYDDQIIKHDDILLMTHQESIPENVQSNNLEENRKSNEANLSSQQFLKKRKQSKNEMISIVESGGSTITLSPTQQLDVKNENRTHICIKCDKDFSTKTNLMRHMLTHDGVKPYQCTICGNGFTQNGSLKSHMLIHTGQKPFRCDVCGRGFTQNKSLTFHMRRHTGEKPFTCLSCGLNFRQKDGLKRHIQIKHTDVQSETHKCTICNRNLHSKYSLALHMRKHLNRQEMLYRCNDCAKLFQTKQSLELHMRQHWEKPFKCDQCNKEFSKKITLTTHMRTHEQSTPPQKQMRTNENSSSSKIFQCGKCFKSFSIKRNLLQHLRNHNKETLNLYKCDDCSIAFETKRGLKLHRYNEHKEAVSDLNECDTCNIPFVSVHDLNQHMISVHDTIDEKCSICMMNFTSKKLYEDHILEHEIYTIT